MTFIPGLPSTDEQVVLFTLTFSRVASLIMLLPGVGEEGVPARVRLAAAVVLTFAAMPFAASWLARYDHILVEGLIIEGLIGFALGLLVRVLYSAAMIAGTYIAAQIGLAGAIFFDPTMGGQSTATSRIIVYACLVLMLSMNLHHVLIIGLLRSYTLDLTLSMAGDLATVAVEAMGQATEVALRMAAPFLAYGILFNLALGLINRLAPQVQLFFIVQPLNIMLGLILLCLCIGPTLLVFSDGFHLGLVGLEARR